MVSEQHWYRGKEIRRSGSEQDGLNGGLEKKGPVD